MSNRRKYEGEEDLQLQLFDVTRDPTFGKHVLRHDSLLLGVHNNKSDLGNPDEVMRPIAKVVH
jgi:hypothetical protein